MGEAMGRKYIDCRDYAQHGRSKKCTVAIFADSETELVEAVVQHGKVVHGYPDSAARREEIRKSMKDAETAL
jgi:predicted small metal-binding protein